MGSRENGQNEIFSRASEKTEITRLKPHNLSTPIENWRFRFVYTFNRCIHLTVSPAWRMILTYSSWLYITLTPIDFRFEIVVEATQKREASPIQLSFKSFSIACHVLLWQLFARKLQIIVRLFCSGLVKWDRSKSKLCNTPILLHSLVYVRSARQLFVNKYTAPLSLIVIWTFLRIEMQ